VQDGSSGRDIIGAGNHAGRHFFSTTRSGSDGSTPDRAHSPDAKSDQIGIDELERKDRGLIEEKTGGRKEEDGRPERRAGGRTGIPAAAARRRRPAIGGRPDGDSGEQRAGGAAPSSGTMDEAEARAEEDEPGSIGGWWRSAAG
jgi:hypothetical protein